MQIWSLSQIPSSEKEDILAKHRQAYNGYKTMQPQVNNEQPLYVQDFAKDKLGATITTDGTVKPYTDYRINEANVMDMCEQCGGRLTEGECTECGWKMEGELQELGIGDLLKGKKYKYTSPSFEDEIEFDTEIEDKSGGKKMYKFKGKKAHHLMGDKDVESRVSSEIDEEKYKTGKLDDIYDEEDLNPSSDFDYVEGGGNDYGTFEKAHHMRKIKNEETATSNAPLSYGKHYNEIEAPYDFKSNGPIGDGGTLRQKNIKEQTVGGGNAAVYDPHFDDPSYDFVSDGPIEDTFTEPADDMDLDDVKKPYDFISNGAEGGGDVYPVNERQYEKMESAFAEEVEEQDVSGTQGMYGRTEKPYAFVSTGPGKAGPYQTHSWGGEQLSSNIEEEYEGEDEDVHWEKDLEDGELELDLTKFNPEDKSWEEITAYTGEDEFSHLDEETKKKLEKQQEKILEMFQRFGKFN